MADVTMPQLGETVTEGTITKWLKAVGDRVDRDEALFEVSTDKVDSEVPSPAAGTLSEIRVAEGDTADVGAVLAVIAGEGEAVGSIPNGSAPAEPSQVPAAQSAPSASGPGAPPIASSTSVPSVSVPEPAVNASAFQADSAPQVVAAAAVDKFSNGVDSSLPEVSAPSGTGANGLPVGGNVAGLVLSPVVRRLLSEHQIDPRSVVGTGVGGRITRTDVLAVIDAGRVGGSPAAGTSYSAPAGTGPAPRPTPLVGTSGQATSGSSAGDDLVIPFNNIRRRTAEHMVRSKATSAHTLVAKEADFEQVERVRRSVGNAFKEEEGFSLTYLPFIARAVIEALRDWPHINASVGDDALIIHRQVNLAIAVDLSFEGLVAPVIHGADNLTVRGLARNIADLGSRARSKKLGPDDLAGGTFTITNPGPFGTFITVPIINQPQVAILSTDGISRRPVVVKSEDGSEAIGIHSVGMLALSFDHRAVDGAYAAAYVAAVAEILATHNWASEL